MLKAPFNTHWCSLNFELKYYRALLKLLNKTFHGILSTPFINPLINQGWT